MSRRSRRSAPSGSRNSTRRCATSSSGAWWKAFAGRAGVPDQETSLATLRVLTAFDHDRQEALKDATRFLDRFTKREIAALDLRIETLLGDPVRTTSTTRSRCRTSSTPSARRRARVPESARVAAVHGTRARRPHARDQQALHLAQQVPGRSRRAAGDQGSASRAKRIPPYDDRDLLPDVLQDDAGRAADVPRDRGPGIAADPNAPPSLVFADSFARAAHRGEADPNEMSAAKILAASPRLRRGAGRRGRRRAARRPPMRPAASRRSIR
jgi:hypothetical protein